jgi:hypothetical protein
VASYLFGSSDDRNVHQIPGCELRMRWASLAEVAPLLPPLADIGLASSCHEAGLVIRCYGNILGAKTDAMSRGEML